MSYQPLDLGSAANDGTGDTLRASGDKINDNFVEIYTLLGDGTSLSSGISATATVVTLTAPTISGVVGGTITSATITTLTGTTFNAGTLALAAGSITDSSGAISFGNENLTTTGSVTAASLDISGNVDIDGTLETDALTIDGVSLAETISDTVGAMVSSNTETNITVTYDDADNTLDFVIGTLNQSTSGNAATATALETARTIHGVSFDGTANIDLSEVVQDTVGAMFSSNTETNITATYQDSDGTIDLVIGTLNQDTTGNAATATALETARTIGGTSFDGTANIAVALSATATALATARTIGGVSFDGTANINLPGVNSAGNQNTTGSAATLTTARTIGGTSFDGSANIAVALSATATALANARTIHGVSFDGTANIDLTEVVQDTVGAMFGSNTETGITATYQDSDGTIDLVIGTLNQDTTGNAATATALETARTIGGTSFDGTANIAVALADTATALATARTIHGVSFDGTANIDLTEVVQDTVGAMFSSNTETNITATYQDADGTIDLVIGTLNQDTTGSAATLTTARTIGGVSFDGSANINLPGVNTAGNQNTSGTAAVATVATTVTITDNESTNENNAIVFTAGGDVDGGNLGLESDGTLTYNPSTGKITATGFVGALTGDVTGDVTGNADTATALATARTIHGVSFDGTGNIDLTEVVQDTVGAMFGSNTETGITVTYQDTDGTIDLVVGTLNQDTTGTAAKVTVTDSTANTNFPVTFHDESNSLLDDTGALRYNPSTGTLLVPNLVVAGTTTQVDTVTMNAENAVIFEGATADDHETTLTIIDPTADRTQRLLNQSGYIPLLAAVTTTAITSTPEELNILDGATVVVGEINALDLGSTAVGTAIASKAVILDSNKDYTGIRNFTVSGELDAATGDFSGDVDVDGTLEADAITVNGTALNEFISDTVGAMVSSNTETGIAVTYQDADNTIDFALNAAQTTITSLLATDIKIGEDDQTKIDFETADTINFYAGNEKQLILTDGALTPGADNILDLGSSSVEFKDAYFDGTVTSDAFAGPLTGNVTGNADTATALATARTIGGVSFDGSANINLPGVNTAGNQNTSGTAAVATTVTITDNESTDENNAIVFTAGGDVDGGNLGLESDGTLTYNPSTGKITATGFVGTLTGNVTGNTSGTAATVTSAAQTNITSVGTLTALQVDNININGNAITSTAGTDLTITPLAGQQIVLDGTIVVDAGVVTGATSITSTAFVGDITGDVTGNADTATTLATARTIGGTSFDGSANIDVALATLATTVTITDNESTNEDNALIFTAGGDVDGGNLGLESDGTLTYNPSTGKVTATGFVGTLTGDVTGDVTGNADTATVLATARTIGGVSFDGSANINLPGVNSAGNQNTSGSAATLTTARTIGGTSFDGSANIAVALATLATTVTITDNESTNEDNAIIFAAGGDVDGGDLGLESDGTLTYNPSTGKVTATGFVGTLTGNVTGNTSGTAATVTGAAQTNITSLGTLTALTVDNIIINGTNIGHTSDTDSIAIAADGVVTFSQAPVFPDGSIAVADLDIDGATDIGAALADADLFIVDDGAGGTNRKSTLARLKTYMSAGSSVAADDLTAGDAAVLLTTSSGNITIDAAADDSDIIIKGTDGTVDTTYLTIDGSDAGSVTFNNQIIVGDGKLVLNSTAVTSTAAELNALDGITAVVGELNALDIGSTAVGTAVASKAVILDSNKDYTGIRNLTISGEIDAATGDYSGAVDIAGATTTAAITASGIIKTDDTTAATSTTDGSLQTDGGLSVALDAVIGDDLIMLSDASVIHFGANSEITLTHVHDVGLTVTNTINGTDNRPTVLQLKSEEDAIVADDVIASIEMAAGDSDGTDGATVAAGIHAIAEDTFSASANKTKLVFTTGVSETAASSATAKATLSSIGDFTVAGDLIIKDGGTIGSASDLDAIAIAADGVVTMNQIPVFSAGINVSGGSIAGTLSTAAQGNITSLGTLTTLTVDNVVINGATIGHGDDTDLMTVADGILTVAGEVSMTTLDIGGTNVTSTAAELNALDGITAVVGELNALDLGSTAVGNAIASKAVILDSNKDYTGVRNFTLSGELDAGSLDVSGNVDIDGTLEADAITVNGTALAEFISDTAGAMVSSNTETGISVTYQDGDNTIDFALAAAQTTITSLLATDIKIGEDDQTKIDFETADEIHFYANNANEMIVQANVVAPGADDGTALGDANQRWSDLFLASGAVVNFDNGDVTATHSSNTLTIAGGTLATAALTTSTIVASGIIKTDDSTEATSTTDGSLQTDGGLSVVKDIVAGDDIKLLSDAAVIHFGANSEITATHVHNVGLTLTHTATGDNTPMVLQLKSEEDAIIANEVIGSLEFAAGDSDGTDGATVAAGIHAIAEGTFSASANATKLVFTTGVSETAASSATAKMTLSSAGLLTIADDFVIKDGGTIGVASHAAAMTIASDGGVTFGKEIVAPSLDISGNVDIDGTLEADAITVNGTTLAETISDTVGAMVSSNTETGITVTYQDADNTLDFTIGTLNQNTTGSAATLTTARTIGGTSFNGSANIDVAQATLATTVTVTDSTANTNFPVVFNDESNALLDDTGALRYNPSTGTLLVPNLVVAGTTTQVDTVTMNAANAVVFEGATADAHETTLTIIDPTADRTINLPNVGGTIPVLAAVSTTQITSTPEELNALDGITAVVGELNALDIGSTAVGTAVASKAVILDSSKDYTGIRNLTISGEIDAATGDFSGAVDVAGATTTAAITASGIIKTDDTTAATSTTDGSLQTDGGLSVAADAVIGDDLFMLSDAAVVTFGADKDVTLTHVADTGLLLNAAMVVQFRDSAINIGSPADGDLDINADDEIELNSTLIDINGNLDVSGTGVIAGAVTTAAITASGIIKTDDTTAATSTTDGSLQTDGGLSVTLDAVIGDDLFMLSDAAVVTFGADKDVTLTHVADTGLLLNAAMVVQFRDSAINIGSPADGDLDINADDEIELNSTLIDVNGNLDVSGTGVIAGAVTTAALTASGIIKTDDTTAATSVTDGSLQTDGGLSVTLDAVIGDDIIMISDAAKITFGANSEITATHVHNVGLTLTHTATGDNTPMVLQLKSEEDAIEANEIIASLEFAAGDSDGTDGATVAAGIHAVAESTFSASANSTKLVFTTGTSETAASSANAKMTLTSSGLLAITDDLLIKNSGTIGTAADADLLTLGNGALTVAGTYQGGGTMTTGGSIVIPDTGTIGSASDTDAIAIASNGVVTFSQIPLLPDNTVSTADIQADAVTGAKIADDAINSEHYAAGSIDTAHIADAQITVGKMAANSVDSAQYVDGSIDNAHYANNSISQTKMGDDSVGSAELKTLSTLLIKDSGGTTLKTCHTAGA